MKREFATTLSFAAIALTLLIPQFAKARTADDSKAEPADVPSRMGQREMAGLMVPAETTLTETLDARKAQPGQQVRVTVSKPIQLKDGPRLPRGTELVATVVADPANASTASKLELRFTQAILKGGKVVPIKATIVGVYSPTSQNSEAYSVTAGNQHPNNWKSSSLQFDQTDGESGVELKSDIASENSGMLLSTKKGVVKLPAGSSIALAIAVDKNG
jgi:hypothetical protein